MTDVRSIAEASAAGRTRLTPRVLVGVALIVALIASVPDVVASESCIHCIEARKTNGWCDACGLGWVGGVEVPSKHLWHVLDAHGHRLNLDNLGCDDCTMAAQTDGYCARSRIGFVAGAAYFSRLTWMLAKADRGPSPTPDCLTCRRNIAEGGWCERCGVGRIGSRVLSDPLDLEHLLHDLEILGIANAASYRCEHCAAAIVTDTQCPFCRVRYQDGKRVQEPHEAGKE